jgi:EpsI family protein
MSNRSAKLASRSIAIAMLIAASAAWWLAPRSVAAAVPFLAQGIPAAFGEWKEIQTTALPVDPRSDARNGRSMDDPYDDVLMRTYGNESGDVILLALAYGKNQRQEVKIHRPELCYVSQGFDILQRTSTELSVSRGSGQVSGVRMLVSAPGRAEAVSYWIRIGNRYTDNAWATRYYLFTEGMKGRVPDGILVRASQIVADPANVSSDRYRLQERFLAELVQASSPAIRSVLVD